MGPRLRKPLERDVASVRLLLRSYLRDQGYSTIDTTTSACIDWFGAANLPPHLTVLGPDVDAHFGVPVSPTVERMTCHLRDELHRVMPGLLAPLVQRFETVQTSKPTPEIDQIQREGAPGPTEPQPKPQIEAIYPIGPDQIRMTAKRHLRDAVPAGLRAAGRR